MNYKRPKKICSLLPKKRTNAFQNKAAKILMYNQFTKTVLKYTDSYNATEVGIILSSSGL